mmetsp:Transcript_22935/g.35694  ORF Transcript_22935/g.35694 Transcript_22935/m.35694 type:complete len:98 (-) Transcript_22935:30-323(-)
MWRITIFQKPMCVNSLIRREIELIQTRLFKASSRCNSDKELGFSADDIDGSHLRHPYWESSGPDDFGFMDELSEFSEDNDFSLSQDDRNVLKNEWKK